MKDRINIGIDGGGTGCRVVVSVDRREAQATGGPANVISDPAGAEAAIRRALSEALGAHSLGLDDLADARIVAGLAGCRLPGAAGNFAMGLPFLAYVVDDSVTALEGAFGGAEGTLVNLGTGSFYIRRDSLGVTHQGGWGFVLGDEGSAAWLGRKALSEVLKISDGSAPEFSDDPLIEPLLAACGVHPVIFAREAKPQDFAMLAPLIMDMDTPWAKALQAQVMLKMHSALEDVGHPMGTPWVLTGGLGRALITKLHPEVAAGLQVPAGNALDGALAMAQALP